MLNKSQSDGASPSNRKQKDLASGFVPRSHKDNGMPGYASPWMDNPYSFMGPAYEKPDHDVQVPLRPKGPTYTVKQDDTLIGIAAAHQVTLTDLLFENNMQLLDADNGRVRYQGQETVIQPGMAL